MTKYLLLLFLVISPSLMAEEVNSFEAELRMLEQKEEAAFERAESITTRELKARELNSGDGMISDSVSTSNAGVQKAEIDSENQPKHSDIFIQPPVVKARRIRSR